MDIIVLVLMACAVLALVKLLMSLLLGVSISYINPFTLSICGFTWNKNMGTSGVITTKIDSIKLYVSLIGLWGYKDKRGIGSKYIFLQIKNVTVDLTHLVSAKESDLPSEVKPNIRPPLKGKHSSAYDKYDFEKLIQIYPENRLLKWILSWTMNLAPAAGVKVLNTTVLLQGNYQINLGNLDMETDTNATFEKRKVVYKGYSNRETNFNFWLSTFNFERLELQDTSNGNILSTFSDVSNISLGFKINFSTGIVKDLKTYVRIKGINISFLYLMRFLNSQDAIIRDAFQNSNKREQSDCRLSKHKLFAVGFLYKLLDSLQISVQFFNISEIPLVDKNKLSEITTSSNASYEEIIFASLKIDNLSMSAHTLDSSKVGYNLKFVEGSYPMNWLASLNSLSCSLDFSTISSYSGTIKKFEVLSVPNTLIHVDSSLFINLLRLVFNNDAEFDQRQTIVDFQYTITNLTFDVSSEQLGILIPALSLLKAKSAESERLFSADSSSAQTTRKWNSNFFEMFVNTSPKWSFKVLFEKPTIVLKSQNESKDNNDIHIVYLTPSLINMEAEVDVISKSVQVITRLDIPNFSLLYQLSNANRNADKFFVVKDINYKSSFEFGSFNDFDALININFMNLNLTKLSTLRGLNEIIFNSLTKTLSAKKQILSKEKAIQNIEDVAAGKLPFEGLFTYIPPWFKKVKIEFNDTCIKIGAKSILMKPELLLDESNYDPFNDDISKNVVPSFVELSLARFDFIICNKEKESTMDSSSSTTGSESSKKPEDYYYLTESSFTNISLTTETNKPGLSTVVREKCVSLPLLRTKVYATKSKKLEIVNTCNSLNLNFSISSNFTIFSSIYLLQHTIVKAFAKSKQSRKESRSKDNSSDLTGETNSPFLKSFAIRNYFREIQVRFKLCDDFQGRIDLFGVKAFAVKTPLFFESKLTRLSVKKDPKTKFYNRLLTFEHLTALIKLSTESEDTSILLNNSNVKLSVPSNFLVHTLIDSIKFTVKVTKRFVYILETSDTESVPPIKEMKTLKLPRIKLRSKALSFVIEDDSFEAELGMIYQLGLVEQRSRLKKLQEFSKYVDDTKKNKTTGDDFTVKEVGDYLDAIYHNPSSIVPANDLVREYSQKLQKLRINMFKSWKNLVTEYKVKKQSAIRSNYQFLTGTLSSSLPVSSNFNRHIVDFNSNAPLMGILLNRVIIDVSTPSFSEDNNSVREYLYRVGKGYPKDSRWNILVPLEIKLTASEARVHLRDYPLPLVYIPASNLIGDDSTSNNSKTFVLSGKMVIAELMPQSKKEIANKYVSVFSDTQSEYYGCEVLTTICKTKLIYDIECSVDSNTPTTATWSNAYQPILRNLDIVFDGFTKPLNDPSLKLGVWDKLRDMFHGSIKFKWINPKGEVQIRVPNSYDPYALLSKSAGFALSFIGNVQWLVNDPERENEKDYFIFKSDNINFGVPNYLATPLPSWNTNRLIFLPSKKDISFSGSIYGYYLNTESYYDPNNKETSDILEITKKNQMKSTNIELEGGVIFKLSMTFERNDSEGKRSNKFKAHWENFLSNPKYVKDKENFDSYKEFRSDFIHMSLSLEAKNSNSNSLRLTPRAIKQFVSWFKKFSAVSPPIRHGPLWNYMANSVKLGRHLMTFKFLFLVEPLYIYHGYRIDLLNPANNSVVALKGKIGKFMCDLHERKEKKIKHVEFLNKEYSVLSMAFYLGSVELHEIDLRAITLSFSEVEPPNQFPSYNFEISDEDQSWINLKDFDEIDLPRLHDFDIDAKVLPLVHAKEFKYSMDPESSESDFGFENSHECGIDLDNFPDSKFNHIFDINKLRFKWYSEVRDIVFDYFTEVEFREAYIFSMSYASRGLIKDRLLNKSKNDYDENLEGVAKAPHRRQKWDISPDSPEKDLDSILHRIADEITGVIPVDKMIIQLTDIQAQLMANMSSEHIILLHTHKNDIKIIELTNKDWIQTLKQRPVAKRFGTVVKSADLYALSKIDFDDAADLITPDLLYGSVNNWPVFLNEEMIEHLSGRNQIFSDICIAFLFEKMNSALSGSIGDLLFLSVPSFKTQFTSSSYRTFFKIVSKLLIYSAEEKRKIIQSTRAIMNSMDSEDALQLFEHLESEIDSLTTLATIQESNDVVKDIEPQKAYIDILLRDRVGKMLTNNFLMFKSLILRTTTFEQNNSSDLEWFIKANEINIDFFDNNRKFLSFSIEDGNFTRTEYSDRSTANEIKIKSVSIKNEDTDILFPELLSAYDAKNKMCQKSGKTYDDMINIKWELGAEIGGLTNVKNAEINCHPMKIALEDKTGLKLMKFLFPQIKMHETDSQDYNLDTEDSYYVVSEDSENEGEGEEDSENDDEDEDDSGESYEAKSIPVISFSGNEHSATNSLIPEPSTHKEDDSEAKSSLLAPSSDARSAKSISDSRKSYMSSIFGQKTSSSNSSNLINLDEEALRRQLSQKNIDYMSERSGKYFSIGKFKFNSFVLSITLYGTGKMRIINVNDLIVSIPSYAVKHKTWGYVDLINSIKKHIIKTLLKHTGKLLKNKLFIYKRKKRVNKINSK